MCGWLEDMKCNYANREAKKLHNHSSSSFSIFNTIIYLLHKTYYNTYTIPPLQDTLQVTYLNFMHYGGYHARRNVHIFNHPLYPKIP